MLRQTDATLAPLIDAHTSREFGKSLISLRNIGVAVKVISALM